MIAVALFLGIWGAGLIVLAVAQAAALLRPKGCHIDVCACNIGRVNRVNPNPRGVDVSTQDAQQVDASSAD